MPLNHEKPIGEVTIREMSELSEPMYNVLLTMLEDLRTMRKDNAVALCDHLLRLLYTDGEAMKYDPGDEEPIQLRINEEEKTMNTPHDIDMTGTRPATSNL